MSVARLCQWLTGGDPGGSVPGGLRYAIRERRARGKRAPDYGSGGDEAFHCPAPPEAMYVAKNS